MLRPGEVIFTFCRFTSPPKKKYCLCICPEKRLFLLINTRAYAFFPHGQVKIWPEELACLSHASYVDVVSVFEIPAADIQSAVAAGHVWPLTQSARVRVKENAKTARALALANLHLIEKNF